MISYRRLCLCNFSISFFKGIFWNVVDAEKWKKYNRFVGLWSIDILFDEFIHSTFSHKETDPFFGDWAVTHEYHLSSFLLVHSGQKRHFSFALQLSPGLIPRTKVFQNSLRHDKGFSLSISHFLYTRKQIDKRDTADTKGNLFRKISLRSKNLIKYSEHPGCFSTFQSVLPEAHRRDEL